MTKIILAMMRRSAESAVAERDVLRGVRIARYPGLARMIATGLLVLMLAGCGFAITHQARRHDVLVVCLIGAGLVALVSALVMEFTRVRASWSDVEVSFSSPWGGVRRLRWNDVAQVRFSSAANWFVVRGRDGTVIRLSTLLGGLGELLGDLKRLADPALQPQIDEAVPQWKRT